MSAEDIQAATFLFWQDYFFRKEIFAKASLYWKVFSGLQKFRGRHFYFFQHKIYAEQGRAENMACSNCDFFLLIPISEIISSVTISADKK